MSIKNIIIIVCLFLVSYGLQGQNAPGLAGKKVSIFYNNNFMVNGWNNTFNQAERLIDVNLSSAISYQNLLEDRSQFINAQHTLQADYALTRLQSLGIGFGYFRNGYGIHYVGGQPVLSRNMIARHLGIHWKVFSRSKGSIAPLGNYYETSLLLFRVNEVWRQNSEFFTDPENLPQESYNMPVFTFGFGKQVVVFSELLLNLGMELGVLIPQNRETFSEFYDFLYQGEVQTSQQRLAAFQGIKFKIGIGLAAF